MRKKGLLVGIFERKESEKGAKVHENETTWDWKVWVKVSVK